MSLKTDAAALADRLEIHARLVARKAVELAEGAEYARRQATVARDVANLIPTPDQHDAEIRAAAAALTNTDGRSPISDAEAERLADDGERYTLMPVGAKIGRRDMNGKKLRSGDRVQVWNSDRYGSPTGVVRGPGPDRDDGKERVLITLDYGQDDRYTPSVGRVERTARVTDNPEDAPRIGVIGHHFPEAARVFSPN